MRAGRRRRRNAPRVSHSSPRPRTGVLLLRAASSASVLRKRKMLPRSASLRSSSRWLLSACRPHATCAAPARP